MQHSEVVEIELPCVIPESLLHRSLSRLKIRPSIRLSQRQSIYLRIRLVLLGEGNTSSDLFVRIQAHIIPYITYGTDYIKFLRTYVTRRRA